MSARAACLRPAQMLPARPPAATCCTSATGGVQMAGGMWHRAVEQPGCGGCSMCHMLLVAGGTGSYRSSFVGSHSVGLSHCLLLPSKK